MGKPISKENIAQYESEWRDRLARHAVSGQTVAAFCKNESVTEGQYNAPTEDPTKDNSIR